MRFLRGHDIAREKHLLGFADIPISHGCAQYSTALTPNAMTG
jgi:hypothetical protein